MKNIDDFNLWLDGFVGFPAKPSLHRIEEIMKALSNPQSKLKFVHIAGTNGKGSTAKIISSVLINSGYKVGLFISPHLERFNERISINHKDILDEDLLKYANKIKPFNFSATYFDICTALAFLHFAENNCDIVVLEVGLGGAFDATNIISNSEVSVITSISLDHTKVLGDTVEEIAHEKCGIIKAYSDVVIYPIQEKGVIDICREFAEQRNAKLYMPDISNLTITECNYTKSNFMWKNNEYCLSLLGAHQIYNAVTALCALDILSKRGYKIQNIASTLENITFEGRMEILSYSPLVIADGAHNEGGVNALSFTLSHHEKHFKSIVIIGMVNDKNHEKCIIDVCKNSDVLIVTHFENERSAHKSTLYDIAKKHANITFSLEIEEAIKKAIELSSHNTVIFICGSLYIVSEAKKILHKLQKFPNFNK